MHRFIALVSLFLFFIWILPLGVFIKPTQEKLACNGKRAICLCSHLLTKTTAKGTTKSLIKINPSTQKESSSGGSSHYFLADEMNPKVNLNSLLISFNDESLYTCQFTQSVEHIPKA